MAKAKKNPAPFNHRLALNQYMPSLFGADKFGTLAEGIKNAGKGIGNNGISQFCSALTSILPADAPLRQEDLLRYDSNILRHTAAIQGRRGEPIRWEYFQYLALLFSEIYLDSFMNQRETLLHNLNNFRQILNARLAAADYAETSAIGEITADDLRKIAFWSATGSGKTLIMHMNIKQYQFYQQSAADSEKLNRILLITPNEGLSRQHKAEFDLSGIQAEIFAKDSGGLFQGKGVEIIEITKLKEDDGDKTVAVEAFEDNNLLLVDEGHRGSTGEDWSKKRRALAKKGFTFEYSATFGQAVAGNEKLAQDYAKAILFDYSYRYFYNDGYGKDYCILNLTEDKPSEKELYLTACLLSFYQQKALFRDQRAEVKKFNIDNPLLIFVGDRVNAVRSERGKTVSDVVDIVRFLAKFTAPHEKATIIKLIARAISGNTGMLDKQGRDIFANAFHYITEHMQTAADIYADILDKVFNAKSGGALHIEDLKAADGEIALRLGDNDDFGIINVGDSAKLRAQLEKEDNIHLADKSFSPSLFQTINKTDSKINILIGSKKFTEGWNSWRVSAMGLMHVGRKEGSQIIQLFGRGVRLKGYNFSLKRHTALPGIPHNQYITQLETLNIFGICADYMKEFQAIIEEEGNPAYEKEEITIKVIRNIPDVELKLIGLKENLDYKKDGDRPNLCLRDDIKRHKITLDWYSRIDMRQSKGIAIGQNEAAKNEAKLTPKHIAFLNMDKLFFALEQFKAERAFFNLNISKAEIANILADNSWYVIFIPQEELEFDDPDKIQLWQELAQTLLQKYCDRFYKAAKSEWESQYRRYFSLSGENGNFFDEYKLRIDKEQKQLISSVNRLKAQLNELSTASPKWNKNIDFGQNSALLFDRHLYLPLIYITKQADIEVKPDRLNEGERDFVCDLREYYQRNKADFADKQLYLLRNQAIGRGMGFFEAGNFYPDFIMWLKTADKQYISFIDPKGLREFDAGDPKLEFYKTIKNTEKELGDANIILNSFIISVTPYIEMRRRFDNKTRAELAAQHILFRESSEYIGQIMAALS